MTVDIERALQWSELPYEAWRETCTTLHLWTQIVGKIRLSKTPWINHSWHATLYVTPRGLTTSPIANGDGRQFQIDFDFVAHELRVQSSDGRTSAFALEPMSVAAFYGKIREIMGELAIRFDIHDRPNEVADPIPFGEDTRHASYDAESANRFWRVLLQSDRVFKQFRAGFTGKCSPVHFFWGSFDLAVTRFSGRPAPRHPGGIPHLPDAVTREAYSWEVSSAGFWPGGGAVDFPAYYSYAYPAPSGFDGAEVLPEDAFFHKELGEFLLPYEAVRAAADPDAALLTFLHTSYAAAAELAGWDRAFLERDPVAPID